MSWINIRFSADQPVPVILRVHVSSEIKSSGTAEQNMSRVCLYSIHPMEFTRCTSCRSCMCHMSYRNTVLHWNIHSGWWCVHTGHSLKLVTVVWWILSMAIVLAREDVEVHLLGPQIKTEHLWLYVWVKCHLEKLRHCQETKSRQYDAPGYLKCPHSHHRSASMFHSWNQAFRIRLPWMFSQCKPSLILGTMWRMAYLTILCISSHRHPGFNIIASSYLPFSVFSIQKFSSCSSIVDVGFFNLLLGCFLWKQESSDEYWVLPSPLLLRLCDF